jgi:hypothetical protein
MCLSETVHCSWTQKPSFWEAVASASKLFPVLDALKSVISVAVSLLRCVFRALDSLTSGSRRGRAKLCAFSAIRTALLAKFRATRSQIGRLALEWSTLNAVCGFRATPGRQNFGGRSRRARNYTFRAQSADIASSCSSKHPLFSPILAAVWATQTENRKIPGPAKIPPGFSKKNFAKKRPKPD